MPDLTAVFARRAFLRLAAAAPILTEAHFARGQGLPPGGALHGQGPDVPPPDAVLINANENPMGPCQAAMDAVARVTPTAGRYDRFGETQMLAMTFAAQHGLKPDNVAVYAGSSEPLFYTVLAFTSPGRGLVVADPSYEAAAVAAAASRAPVRKVALTPDYAHDVMALAAADPDAGVIYICNPNNPTGTITRRADILWVLDHKPAGAVLLVDEAYIHLSDAEDVLDMVAAGRDLIVLRTFSKIYGLAGIRCGLAIARPDLLARLQMYGQNPMVVTASAAARASLLDPGLVPMRKRVIGDTRRDTVAWLRRHGFKVIGEPQTNCFMIDTGRDGRAVAAAMQARKVYIGRSWPVWPQAVRVSVGTPAEMARFKAAFAEVMSRPA